MVIVYLVAALLGAGGSCFMLWPYGLTIALVSMPFGGSLLALFAAIVFSMRSSEGARTSNSCKAAMD